jgi:hypothetical protein
MESVISSFGGEDKIAIYTDRTFIHKNNIPANPKATCVKGIIAEDQYNLLLNHIRASNIVNAKINQQDDYSIVCDGGLRINIYIDGESNEIDFPCVGESTPETKQISKLANDMQNKAISVINKAEKKNCIL